MADCSKTEVFLEEWNRLCDYFYAKGCVGCPFYLHLGVIGCDCLIKEHPKKAVLTIQQWSDSNPVPKPKTYADDFFEKHPKASRYTRYGITVPTVQRCFVYECECDNGDCTTCWNEPYKE